MDKKIVFFVFIIIIAVIIYLALPVYRIPDGVPADYFERISLIEDTKSKVFLYSDDIDFNGDLDIIKVNNIDDIPLLNLSDNRFLIIDMNKYDSNEFGTAQEIENLYRNQCFYIIIVNNKTSRSGELNQLFADGSSDLITLTFDACHGNYYTETNNGELPSFQILMYAILDKIGYIIEGI